MAEIKCPHCGKVFTVDESGYMAIASQIRDKEFEKELKKKEEAIVAKYDLKKSDEEKALNDKITALLHQLEDKDKEKEIALLNATSELKEENIKLQNMINGEKDRTQIEVTKAVSKEKEALAEANKRLYELESEVKVKDEAIAAKEISLKATYDAIIKEKDEQIGYYRDLKAKLNNKMIGESLEQHCSIEFNKIRATAFKNAYFEKDNDAKGGTKGDFIFRDFDDEGTEIVSIMFEMKNEMDTTSTKHKNEDFLDKLDKDRKEKNCEYAILVSLLEADNELYNQGIVDVSYKFDKMYVIRPQFFIPIITMLRNACINSLSSKKEIERIKNANIDVENFNAELNLFKTNFSKDFVNAKNRFDDAIKEIDATIVHLTEVKENLRLSSKHLRLANDKAEELSIKKLTKNSPSLKEKFEEIKK